MKGKVSGYVIIFDFKLKKIVWLKKLEVYLFVKFIYYF